VGEVSGQRNALPGAEIEYLKVVGETFNVECENDGVDGAEHPHVLMSI
jgi:hypothetical protein